jgi:hypothetical protein
MKVTINDYITGVALKVMSDLGDKKHKVMVGMPMGLHLKEELA